MAAGANAVTQMSLMPWPEHIFPRYFPGRQSTVRNLGTVVEAKGNATKNNYDSPSDSGAPILYRRYVGPAEIKGPNLKLLQSSSQAVNILQRPPLQ